MGSLVLVGSYYLFSPGDGLQVYRNSSPFLGSISNYLTWIPVMPIFGYHFIAHEITPLRLE